MLIIFDLDDTLINTSNFITPIKLKKIFYKWVSAGLKAKNLKKEFFYLLKLDKSSLSTKETLKKFLTNYLQEKVQEKKKSKENFEYFLELAIEELNKKDIPTVKPLKDANKILKELASFHKLAIVTKGIEDIQKEKLKKSGIDTSFFSIIDVTEKNKKYSYKKILKTFKINPEEVIVCGDRVENDLKPAKLLNLKTVHMKVGRGMNYEMDRNFMDFQVKDLKELKKIIDKIMETKWF